MLTETTVSKLREMRLSVMANALKDQLVDPQFQNMTFEDRLGLLVDAEWNARKNNHLNKLIRQATFSDPGACLENVEYLPDRGLKQEKLLRFSTCNYIQEHHNIILLGATGSGKTYLACALGMAAARRFYAVKYIRLPDLLVEFQIARGNGTIRKLMAQYKKYALLIIDEWLLYKLKETEAKLIDAKEKAETADRLKSAFLANMSHEIRTPLNAIVGFSHLMTIADNAEDEKLYSDIINQNSEILLQLINDILDLAKIEAGTLEYIRYPMDLGELCRNVYEMHKDRVQTGVVLILDNKDTSLIINEDQNRIMQVVTNLITNAIKFTFKGEIRFGFEVREEYIDFYVKDTGMGISEEKIKMIFERFVKLNTFVQGTGLGLAICRVIVEKLGGEITAESKLNEGSTFRFTIPYKAGKKIPESGKAMKCPESGSTGPRKVLQRRTVLVAEDVDSNFVLIKNMIGKDYTLLWAKDGFEAVEMYKQFQPDLILMDIRMPIMDGIQATEKIRTISLTVPIVAVTAYAFYTEQQQAAACLSDVCDEKGIPQMGNGIRGEILGRFHAQSFRINQLRRLIRVIPVTVIIPVSFSFPVSFAGSGGVAADFIQGDFAALCRQDSGQHNQDISVYFHVVLTILYRYISESVDTAYANPCFFLLV